MEDRYCVSCECYLKNVEGKFYSCLNQGCNLYRVAQLGLSEVEVSDDAPPSPEVGHPLALPPSRVTETFTKTS